MKIIITGTTGMVGKGTLLEAIKDPNVESILIINRSTAGINDPKVKEVLHKDFFDLSAVRHGLTGYDATLFCLGVSSVGMSEGEYRRMTYDLTMGFAREVLALNPGMTFCYISGSGTDSSEKGRLMWARVKGKTENDLAKLGFKAVYMFRPGFIQPFDGVRAKSNTVNWMYRVFSPFYFLLKKIPAYVTDTRTLGRAMVRVARLGYDKTILENKDINQIGRS
jgi:uncharacterized protein YbjT (DUF2867 family)